MKTDRRFRSRYTQIVFKGIAEFAAYPPEVITGDNYEQRGAQVMGDILSNVRGMYSTYPKSTRKFVAVKHRALNGCQSIWVTAISAISLACQTWFC